MKEHPIYEPTKHEIVTGRYIRASAGNGRGIWIISHNSVDDGISISFSGDESFKGIKGLNESDIAAIRKACDLFLMEDSKSYEENKND